MPEVVTKTDEDGNTYQEALMEQMTSQQMEKYKLASDNYSAIECSRRKII